MNAFVCYSHKDARWLTRLRIHLKPVERVGNIELWDETVKVCHHSFSPIFNRCVVFTTNEMSYHGVTAVTCPPDQTRKSFAAYYYTREAPVGWTGRTHTTIFKARPNEVVKGRVLMPLESAKRNMVEVLRGLKTRLKRTLIK